MQKAMRLLSDYRDMTVSEVADRCGYSLMTNFTRAFVRYYGIKPSELRMQKNGASGQTEQGEIHNPLIINNSPPRTATLRIAKAA